MQIDFAKVEGILNHVLGTAEEGNPASIIEAIDKYTETVPTMHVGSGKGAVMDALIEEHKPKVLIELGGYFGYSAIRFAALAKKQNPEAHYYSVEFSPVLASVIEKLVRFAGLDDSVTVLSGDLTKTLPDLKKRLQARHGTTHVDFLLLDHEKDAYVSDLELAKKEGLLRKGTAVVADNIIRPGAPEYKKYMETETTLYSSTLVPVGGDAVLISIANN